MCRSALSFLQILGQSCCSVLHACPAYKNRMIQATHRDEQTNTPLIFCYYRPPRLLSIVEDGRYFFKACTSLFTVLSFTPVFGSNLPYPRPSTRHTLHYYTVHHLKPVEMSGNYTDRQQGPWSSQMSQNYAFERLFTSEVFTGGQAEYTSCVMDRYHPQTSDNVLDPKDLSLHQVLKTDMSVNSDFSDLYISWSEELDRFSEPTTNPQETIRLEQQIELASSKELSGIPSLTPAGSQLM